MKKSDRDKNFRRLCKWVADAAEMAEIACQESDRINYLMKVCYADFKSSCPKYMKELAPNE